MATISIDSTSGGQVRPLLAAARHAAINLRDELDQLRRVAGDLTGHLADTPGTDLECEAASYLVQLHARLAMLERHAADLAASVEHHTDNGGSS